MAATLITDKTKVLTCSVCAHQHDAPGDVPPPCTKIDGRLAYCDACQATKYHYAGWRNLPRLKYPDLKPAAKPKPKPKPFAPKAPGPPVEVRRGRGSW